MTSKNNRCLQGEIVEESVQFSLTELCRASGATEEQLKLWVAEGALEPQGEFELHSRATRTWVFSGSALRRAVIAHRLESELEVNPAGVALALDLIDQIEDLRRRR